MTTELAPLEDVTDLEARYPGEWVALADMESDPGPVFRRGRVVWHGEDPEDGWAVLRKLDTQYCGVLYLGVVRADVEPFLIL